MYLLKIIEGGSHSDSLGPLVFNILFDALAIKRLYIIQNSSAEAFCYWRGHKVVQLWYSVKNGSFEMHLIMVENLEKPS